MPLNWHYPETAPFQPQGKNTTAQNFAREDRSSVGILVREALQNPLDAPAEGHRGPIRIAINYLRPGDFEADYLNLIFDTEFRQRLKAAQGPELPDAAQAHVLVIEDFGTKGLSGDTHNPNTDGPNENWNAFWHREGEGVKGTSSNGGAGQGKITYYSQSHACTVLGLTRRTSDNTTLLMGRASFPRDYPFDTNKKYCRSGYWTKSSARPEPEKSRGAIKKFTDAFHLSKRDVDAGLSIVIPFAKPFSEDEAIQSVILDFYAPIIANRLEVSVGETTICATTIDNLAATLLPDGRINELGSSFSKGYRTFVKSVVSSPTTDLTLPLDWSKERTIPETIFPQGALETLRKLLETGKRVGITLPIRFKPRNELARESSFNVYIEAPETLERNEEAFIRNDLLIGAERPLSAGTLTKKVRSLTWIQTDLSEFLLAAEEPTHLKWNSARAKELYANADETLRSIRQAVPRLLITLLSGIQKKDTKALSSFFPRATSTQTNSGSAAGKNKRHESQSNDDNSPPPLNPIPLLVSWEKQKVTVCTNPKVPIAPEKFPFGATIEFAYLGFGDDGFEEYDPYDFDLSHVPLFPATIEGGTISSRSENRIELNILNSSFALSISGFDPHFRVRHKLTYDLANVGHATSDNTEQQHEDTNA